MDYIQMVHSGKLPDNCPFCDSEHIYEEREVYKDEQTYTMITRIKSHVYCEHCGRTIWNIDTNPKNI